MVVSGGPVVVSCEPVVVFGGPVAVTGGLVVDAGKKEKVKGLLSLSSAVLWKF